MSEHRLVFEINERRRQMRQYAEYAVDELRSTIKYEHSEAFFPQALHFSMAMNSIVEFLDYGNKALDAQLNFLLEKNKKSEVKALEPDVDNPLKEIPF